MPSFPTRRFLSPLWLLLQLRWRVAAKDGARGVTPVLLFVLGPAALALGRLAGAALDAVFTPRDEWLLASLLLATHAAWTALLLSGIFSLGRNAPAALLDPLPVSPGVTLWATILGGLLDVPLLLVLPVLTMCGAHFARAGIVALLLALVAFALFALHTATLAALCEQIGKRLGRRRRAPLLVVACAALLLGTNAAVPSALRAASTSHVGQEQAAVRRAARQSVAPPPAWTVVLPSGAAAQSIGAAKRGAWLESFAALALLGAHFSVTLWLAFRLVNQPVLEVTSSSARRLVSSPNRVQSQKVTWQTLLGAITAHEWRHLTRNTNAHTTLRSPAILFSVTAAAFVLANGGSDPASTSRDLGEIGVLLYALLWQAQFVSNRWGSESGTAHLLFGFPIDRRLLVAGRNLALGGLLLLVDETVSVGFCVLAGWRHLVLPVALWVVPVVVALTTLGNLVSARAPFPLSRRGSTFAREPERGWMFWYAVLGFGVWAMLWPIAWALRTLHLVWAVPAGVVYLVLLWAGSVWFAARETSRYEMWAANLLDEKA